MSGTPQGSIISPLLANLALDGVEEAALIVAMIILVVDGDVPEEEQEYIDNLCEALGISQERALEIIDELFAEDEDYEEEEE